MPCTQVVEADVAVDGLPRLIIRLPVYYLLQNISPTKVTYISCLIVKEAHLTFILEDFTKINLLLKEVLN